MGVSTRGGLLWLEAHAKRKPRPSPNSAKPTTHRARCYKLVLPETSSGVSAFPFFRKGSLDELSERGLSLSIRFVGSLSSCMVAEKCWFRLPLSLIPTEPPLKIPISFNFRDGALWYG